jgi:hypothetical protein
MAWLLLESAEWDNILDKLEKDSIQSIEPKNPKLHQEILRLLDQSSRASNKGDNITAVELKKQVEKKISDFINQKQVAPVAKKPKKVLGVDLDSIRQKAKKFVQLSGLTGVSDYIRTEIPKIVSLDTHTHGDKQQEIEFWKRLQDNYIGSVKTTLEKMALNPKRLNPVDYKKMITDANEIGEIVYMIMDTYENIASRNDLDNETTMELLKSWAHKALQINDYIRNDFYKLFYGAQGHIEKGIISDPAGTPKPWVIRDPFAYVFGLPERTPEERYKGI